MKPEISVVMPVLNGEKYLRKAIDSILNQSFYNLELIIINDGSTDTTEDIVKSYKDLRIVYIKNTSTKGLSVSFNIGIRIARADFIARMDADDISTTDRFEKQLHFLKNHPEVGIVGSTALLIDEDGKILKKHSRPTRHIDIKWQSLFSAPLVHPTVMVRADILKDNPYDETLENSEDYELWSRLLFLIGIRFGNISEPLLLYRTHQSFTQKLDDEKRANSAKNTIRNIEEYMKLTELEKETLTFLRQDKVLNNRELRLIWDTYLRAAHAFSLIEKVGFPTNIRIYGKLVSLGFFLLKHKVKKLLRPV